MLTTLIPTTRFVRHNNTAATTTTSTHAKDTLSSRDASVCVSWDVVHKSTQLILEDLVTFLAHAKKKANRSYVSFFRVCGAPGAGLYMSSAANDGQEDNLDDLIDQDTITSAKNKRKNQASAAAVDSSTGSGSSNGDDGATGDAEATDTVIVPKRKPGSRRVAELEAKAAKTKERLLRKAEEERKRRAKQRAAARRANSEFDDDPNGDDISENEAEGSDAEGFKDNDDGDGSGEGEDDEAVDAYGPKNWEGHGIQHTDSEDAEDTDPDNDDDSDYVEGGDGSDADDAENDKRKKRGRSVIAVEALTHFLEYLFIPRELETDMYEAAKHMLNQFEPTKAEADEMRKMFADVRAQKKGLLRSKTITVTGGQKKKAPANKDHSQTKLTFTEAPATVTQKIKAPLPCDAFVASLLAKKKPPATAAAAAAPAAAEGTDASKATPQKTKKHKQQDDAAGERSSKRVKVDNDDDQESSSEVITVNDDDAS